MDSNSPIAWASASVKRAGVEGFYRHREIEVLLTAFWQFYIRKMRVGFTI